MREQKNTPHQDRLTPIVNEVGGSSGASARTSRRDPGRGGGAPLIPA